MICTPPPLSHGVRNWAEHVIKGTVEPRLTNTLVKRTPLLNERFWPVPNIFPVKSCLKTPPWADNLALPAERTAVCPPKVFVCEVFTLKLKFSFTCKLQPYNLSTQQILHLPRLSAFLTRDICRLRCGQWVHVQNVTASKHRHQSLWCCRRHPSQQRSIGAETASHFCGTIAACIDGRNLTLVMPDCLCHPRESVLLFYE